MRSAREQSLPVYIEVPRDLVGAEVGRCQCCHARPAEPEALAECADEILEKLAKARAPVLVVDVEIRRYGIEHETAALARHSAWP